MPTLLLQDSSKTRAFGAWLAGQLKPGDIVSLEGPLGAGKTTLVQGLAGALGIKKITSPTFVLFRQYLLDPGRTRRATDDKKTTGVFKKPSVKKNKIKWLVHADMYRVKNPREAILAGLGEYFSDLQGVVVVEWGDLIAKILPKRVLRVKLSMDPAGRKIEYPARLGSVDALNLSAQKS